MRGFIVAGLALGLAACEEVGPGEFSEPLQLGGEVVDIATLNRGRRAYNTYCSSCHGLEGNGMGPLGYQQQPRARDLRHGIIKFASVSAGALPTDADLARVIRRGLKGTAMLAWRVPEAELNAVVQYVKSFSPRWREEEAGTPIEVSDDPWTGRSAEAQRRGRRLYHTSLKCASCHPAYARQDELREMATSAGLEPGAVLRDKPREPVTREGTFGRVTAPDFQRDPMRAGDTPEDLYRAVAAGVGGTAMPSWKGAASEEDLWAVVHYLRSLVRGDG